MRKILVSAFTVALVLSTRSVLFGQTITVMAQENPPFNTATAGEPRGASTDMLLRMAEIAGIPLSRSDIKTYPWARSYDIAKTTPNTILAPVVRNSQLEGQFLWIGPIYKIDIGLIAPKSKKLKIQKITDAIPYRIGTIRDGVPEKTILAMGVPASSLDQAPDLVSNLKKLQAGRLDMLAFSVLAARSIMPGMGMNPDDYETLYVLSSSELYYAMNLGSNIKIRDALQKALDGMKASGEFSTIIGKYLK